MQYSPLNATPSNEKQNLHLPREHTKNEKTRLLPIGFLFKRINKKRILSKPC